MERNQPENYRSISLLSIFDKIIEKLTYKRLSDFLENNHILFGFIKKSFNITCSDGSNGLYLPVLDNYEATMGIFIDLQKAFDNVNHYIVLKDLKYMALEASF